METLRERATKLEAEGVFLGGPAEFFETAGRKLLATLLNEEVSPYSKVLDIGCGCLRGGYWLIHFLDADGYFGIEPNVKMLEAGTRILLEPGLVDLKRPRFDHNADFDFTVFGESFDYFVARSIWTHASKQQIETMLDQFLLTASEGGVFLTSYVGTTLLNRDYKGAKWVGKSHESDAPGVIRHSLKWIREVCGERGLTVTAMTAKEYNFSNQTWLRINRTAG